MSEQLPIVAPAQEESFRALIYSLCMTREAREKMREEEGQ